jgi:uncharacterized protein (DUF433 family)
MGQLPAFPGLRFNNAILHLVKAIRKFYDGLDPRYLGSYGLAETSHYLLIPQATVRSWVVGRPYPTKRGKKYFEPVIELPDRDIRSLSFINLIEVHVLDAIRREHSVPLDKIRIAIDYLGEQFGSEHPLAEESFATDGLDLFVDKFGQIINVSRAGQLGIKTLLQAHLRRIDRDAKGVALRLYPFTRKRSPDEPRVVVIDPYVSFGRPVLVGTGIATSVVAERYKAGESIEQLCTDYGRERLEIEEAIRCELELEAA